MHKLSLSIFTLMLMSVLLPLQNAEGFSVSEFWYDIVESVRNIQTEDLSASYIRPSRWDIESGGISFSTGKVAIGSTSFSSGAQDLDLDVAGPVGATHYCDEDGDNCVTPANLASDVGRVKVDAAATADYLGATGSTGSLRVNSDLTYSDGGNYVTLSVNEANLSCTTITGGAGLCDGTDANDNDYADSLSFNTGTGVLTVGRTGSLPDLTYDLDGRYLESYTETQNVFRTINAPSGTDPVADSTTDTLNFAAGSDISITGNSSTDTITIASTFTEVDGSTTNEINTFTADSGGTTSGLGVTLAGGSNVTTTRSGDTITIAATDTDNQNLFQTFNAPSGTDPVADSATDTLNFAAGSNITITGDSGTDTITIAATGGGDITTVGDCTTGDCFTGSGDVNQLTFEGTTANINHVILQADEPASTVTLTLPATGSSTLVGEDLDHLITGEWTIADETPFSFGSDGDWEIEYEESSTDQLIFSTTNTGSIMTDTNPMFLIQGATTPDANQQLFGVSKGGNVVFWVDEDGDGAFDGNIELGDEQWVGIPSGALIEFDSTPSPDEIEMLNARVGINTTTVDTDLYLQVNGRVGANEYCDQTGANCVASSNIVTSAITSLEGQTGATQTFADDTNVTITSASNIHTLGWSGTLSVSRGGIGVGTLTDGGVLLGNGTGALQAMSILSNGHILVGDGVTDPTTAQLLTSSTGTVRHEMGGLEANISGYANGIIGMLSGTTADIDTIGEFSTALGITGTASSSTFLRGDGTWDSPSVTETQDLDDVVSEGDTTTQLVNLDGGIAVDTSNFTVSGTNGDITTAGDLTVSGVTTLNGNITLGDSATADNLTVTAGIQGSTAMRFEGSTDDGNTTNFVITDPAASNNITFPDATGTVVLHTSNTALSNNLTLTSAKRIMLVNEPALSGYYHIAANSIGTTTLLTTGDGQIERTGVETGYVLILKGTSEPNKVQFVDGFGLVLAGGISFTLGADDTIQLVYDGTNWVELSRSNN